MNFDFDTRQSVQEAFEDAALRRRRREVELKRLQVEDAKLELQRAQLQQSSRARPRGRGTGPPHKYGNLPSGGGRTGSNAKPGTARKQRRGQGSLERRREARAAAREAALAQSAASKDMMSRVTLRASLAPSVLLPTAPAFEPASVRQWQDQHSQPVNQRLDASHVREQAIEHTGTFHPTSYTYASARQDQAADHSRSTEDSTRRFSDHVASQMGSAKWAGWTMICDMLNDSEPANRASAVNTLRVMTNDMGSNHQIRPDVGSVAAYSNNATDMASSNEVQKMHPSIDTSVHRQPRDQQLVVGDNSEPTTDWQAWWQQLSEQQRIDAQAQREEACQAVLEHGAVGQLVGLLNSEEHVQTQIAATHVLRNVVTHAARQPESSDPVADSSTVIRRDDGHLAEQTRRRPTSEGDPESRAVSGEECVHSLEGNPTAGATMGEECVKTIMEEADVVGPIIDLLDSEDAVVRSSALGTVSELAHASEEARQQFFQQPALLPYLLNVVEKARAAASPPDDTANLSLCANKDQHNSSNENSSAQGCATATGDISGKYQAGELDDGTSKVRFSTTKQGEYLDDDNHPALTNVWLSNPDGLKAHSRAASSGSSDEVIEATPSPYGATKTTTALADGAQAMGVLKLMLEKEESAKRVRDAIATRPGVIESIVNVATLAPPPSEEAVLVHSGNYSGPLLEAHEARAVRAANDALLGLGGHSREAAATAVVQLLGQRSSSSGSENGPTPNPRPNAEKGEAHDTQQAPAAVTFGEVKTSESEKSYAEGTVEDNHRLRAGCCGNTPDDGRFDDDENPCFDELSDFETHTSIQMPECSNAQGLHHRCADELDPSRNLQRRQLAAMATLRNLLTTPDPAAEAEEDNVISTGSLRAVRNAGGVDAVVSLLGHQDPCTQASASLTLMAMVKADDERKRCANLVRSRRRRDDQNLDGCCERCAADDDDTGARTRSDSVCNASDDDGSELFSNEEVDNVHGEAARGKGTDPLGTYPNNDEESVSVAPTEDEPGSLAPNTADASSLRAVIAENEEAIPRLVSVLSQGTEQPAAAVQAAAALATLVEESPEPATTHIEVVDAARQTAPEGMSSEAHDGVNRPNESDGMADAQWQQQHTQHAQDAQAILSSPDGCWTMKATENLQEESASSTQCRTSDPSAFVTVSSTTDTHRTRRTSKHVTLLKQQLKQAIEADSSVIPAVVELLRDSIEAGSGANAAARHLADTLRAVATSDLVNQMRIRDAGGVRPIMAVLAHARDEQTSVPAVNTALNVAETLPIETDGRNDTSDQLINGNRPFESFRAISSSLCGGNSADASDTGIEGGHLHELRENRDQRAQDMTVAGPASERRTSIDSSSPRPGCLIGEAWLTTEPPLSTNESAESVERDSHAICHPGPPNALQDRGRTLEASVGKHYSVDDIGVRLRTPRSSEFDYGCNYERIVSHPMGFSLWFATHSIVRSMRGRVNAALQDYNKANVLLEMLQREESELLRIMGRQKGDTEARSGFMRTNQEQASCDGSHLERYYRLQHEIDYTISLLHNLERECAFHNAVRRYQFKFGGVETEANAKAELHLLESTFKVLGEISQQ